jgi:hypothetical protein
MNRLLSLSLSLACIAFGLGLSAGGHETLAAASARPAAVTRCYTNQLAVYRDTGNSGAGHVGVYFRLHNRSPRACTLFGYPGVQLLDGRGQYLHTVLHWGVGYLSGNQARRLVYLRPGGDAFFLLEWVHIPSPGQTCPHAPALLITPPNTYRSIRVSMTPGYVDACGGILNAGPVEPVRLP